MLTVIIIAAFALASAITGIFMFFGKGSFLIAGYNTMSTEEKAKFDKRKLCAVAGIIMIVVAVMLAVMAFLGYRVEAGIIVEDSLLPFAGVFVVVILAAVAVCMILANTYCRRK